MPTTRTHAATQAGPVTLDLSMMAGRIEVRVEPRTHAEVVVSTPDAEGSSAEAVKAAAFSEGASRLGVRVPRTGGGSTVIQTGGMQINSVRGGVTVFGSGVTMVNGRIINAGSGTVVVGDGTVVVGGNPITIEARLPEGSSLIVETTSADVDTHGHLPAVDVHSVSGDARIDSTTAPQVRTISGDVEIRAFAGSGRIQTVSGDINVHATADSVLSASSVSGDIRTTGARVRLDAHSVSGRVSSR